MFNTWLCARYTFFGTLEDDSTVLYKTKSLDGTKPNTNPKTNPNPNTNLEHRPVIFKLANFCIIIIIIVIIIIILIIQHRITVQKNSRKKIKNQMSFNNNSLMSQVLVVTPDIQQCA